MPTMDEIKDGYFNYLVNEMLDALLNANKYNCKDFELLRLELLRVHKIFDTRQGFEDKIKILRLYDKKS